MRFADLFACAGRELGRRKPRTAAAVLGYALAVAAMVVVISSLRSARLRTDEILTSTGTHFIIYSPAGAPACEACRSQGDCDGEEGFVVYGGFSNLISYRALDGIRSLPTVRDASPYIGIRLKDPSGQGTFTLGGFDPASPSAVATTCCAATDIIDGKFPDPGEDGAVLLEEGFAAARKLRAGGTIDIAGQPLRVAGVVNPGIRPAKADVYLHLADARRAAERRWGPDILGREANVILVEVKSSQVQDEAIRKVKELYPGIVVSTYACYRPAAAVMGMNESAAWLLTGLVGLFAIAFALKSQLASVMERRRELAILKSIGWPDGSILRQVLIESGLQALLGGIIGSAAAAGALLAIPARLLVGPLGKGGIEIVPAVFVAAVVLAAAAGAVAGLLPALAAARQDPAEALRRI